MKNLPTEQAPGFYRHRVGGIVVTALNDGALRESAGVLTGIDAAGAAAILQAAFRPATPVITINSFLVQTADRTVLIDTGCGTKMGPTAGRMMANLQAAGVDPADIDLVLLTHLHPDHVNGLIKTDGTPAFPAARVQASAADAALFLDEAIAQRVPEAAKPVFAMARDAVTPYGDRFSTFQAGEIVAGITVVPLPGHTPGHSGFRIRDGGDSLLIWGDISHVPDLQSQRPDVGMIFDADSAKAGATRQAAFETAAHSGELIAGMHLLFPGFIHVARAGEAFRFAPLMWSPMV